MKYSLETVYQVWDDEHGTRIEVGPDRDSVGLVEIRQYTDDDKVSSSVEMTREQAAIVLQALAKFLGS